MENTARTGVIIAAAGTGSRMGEGPLKQLRLIDGKPILAHSISVFDRHEEISEIIVVLPGGVLPEIKKTAIEPYGFGKIKALVPGGEHRQASVRHGLNALSQNVNYVLIHDAARPFLEPCRITDVLQAAKQHGAASLGVRPKDTIKLTNAAGTVESTLPRENLWLVQTPQCFARGLIVRAHEQAVEEGFVGTDDAVLVERMGTCVRMVAGDYGNFKVTTPGDLAGCGDAC